MLACHSFYDDLDLGHGIFLLRRCVALQICLLSDGRILNACDGVFRYIHA